MINEGVKLVVLGFRSPLSFRVIIVSYADPGTKLEPKRFASLIVRSDDLSKV
jgi:hypothetical protein